MNEAIQKLVAPNVVERKSRPNIIIGGYDDINGDMAKEISGATITEAEVLMIIRGHAKKLRAVDDSFAQGSSGSWEIRQMPYSNARVSYWAQFTDPSEVQAIFDDVYADFDGEPIGTPGSMQ